MATLLENLELEKRHFENFKDHIPEFKNLCARTVQALLDLGIIQVSTAGEHAVANLGNTQVISKFNADLANGDDVKLSSVRTSNYGKTYSAPIHNIKGKTGYIRAQVYERKLGKFYYFVIPASAHSEVPNTSNIEIPFTIDGRPRRIPTREVYENWWNYEVDSFQDMCRARTRKIHSQVSQKTLERAKKA